MNKGLVVIITYACTHTRNHYVLLYIRLESVINYDQVHSYMLYSVNYSIVQCKTQLGLLAQSVERGADNAKVVSSSLTQTSIFSLLSSSFK